MEKSTVQLTVERLNPDAPIQFRLLCKAVFKSPAGVELFADDEYQLLDREVVAAWLGFLAVTEHPYLHR